MNRYFMLLSPRLWSMTNRVKNGGKGSWKKSLILGVLAAVFWCGIFVAFFKVLEYFQGVEGFGHILARKLMGMVWLTFFAVLLFSNVVTALSTFFLSKDLQTIHASPVPQETIYWARLTDTLVDSSWMVLLFGLPIFLAYGFVFNAGALYYIKLAAVAPPFLIIATSISAVFTMVLVNVFPAQRTKDILFLLTIMVVIVLYLMFRIIQPEKLVNPDAFSSAVNYFSSLSAPGSPLLPSYWAAEVLWPSLSTRTSGEQGFYLPFLWSTAAAMAVIGSWIAQALYGYGFSKSQEGARRFIQRINPLRLLIALYTRPFARPSRVMIAKDIRTFFRDNSQWSQLLLLLALIVIYLYNFSVLDLKRSPIPTFYLQNFISFLNIALASFVTASLAVRFAFPAISQEGFSYWILRSSPLSLERLMWTKFAIYAPVLILVAEILVVLSNYLLNVTPLMMAISTITIFFITLGIVSLAIGLGGVYPRFEAENLASVATGFGGLIFMVLAALYAGLIVILEAWPVYTLFMTQTHGWVLPKWKTLIMVFCGLLIILTNILVVYLPMKIGRDRLSARESSE